MSTLEHFETFIENLKHNPHISIIKETIDKNRRLLTFRNVKENMNEIYEKTKIKVPQEDWCYEELGSLILDWDATVNEVGEEYLWGGFKLHTFSSVLGMPSHFWDIYNNDSRFWNNNPQPKAEAIWKDFLPKLNYFHKSGHGDDGTFGCLLREEGVYPCPVYFYDSGIWFEMNFTLEEYYNNMLECKAVYYWQYFYIKTETIVEKLGNFKPMYEEYGANYFNGPHPFMNKFKDGTFTTSTEAVLYQMEVIIERFPKLFPDVDTTYFIQQYEALKSALNKDDY